MRPSDMNEHFPVLRAYASGCSTILELGVRHVVSTWAFLRGLMDSPATTKSFVCCDLERSPNIEDAEEAAKAEGIPFRFVHGGDMEHDFEPADLIFIDTWHVYGQLKRELEKFSKLAKRWMILHDTTTFAEISESIVAGGDPEEVCKMVGWEEHEVAMGLWPAVEEFLEANENWKLEVRYTHCNGLTVLERLG